MQDSIDSEEKSYGDEIVDKNNEEMSIENSAVNDDDNTESFLYQCKSNYIWQDIKTHKHWPQKPKQDSIKNEVIIQTN